MAPTASPTRSPISTPGPARTREVRPRPQTTASNFSAKAPPSFRNQVGGESGVRDGETARSFSRGRYPLVCALCPPTGEGSVGELAPAPTARRRGSWRLLPQQRRLGRAAARRLAPKGNRQSAAGACAGRTVRRRSRRRFALRRWIVRSAVIGAPPRRAPHTTADASAPCRRCRAPQTRGTPASRASHRP